MPIPTTAVRPAQIFHILSSAGAGAAGGAIGAGVPCPIDAGMGMGGGMGGGVMTLGASTAKVCCGFFFFFLHFEQDSSSSSTFFFPAFSLARAAHWGHPKLGERWDVKGSWVGKAVLEKKSMTILLLWAAAARAVKPCRAYTIRTCSAGFEGHFVHHRGPDSISNAEEDDPC